MLEQHRAWSPTLTSKAWWAKFYWKGDTRSSRWACNHTPIAVGCLFLPLRSSTLKA
jgi:hypothetical protein